MPALIILGLAALALVAVVAITRHQARESIEEQDKINARYEELRRERTAQLGQRWRDSVEEQ